MFDQFTSSIVGILTKKGSIVGTGFLISEKHVLTCAHVVAQASGVPTDTLVPPKKKVPLNFLWLTGEESTPHMTHTSHLIFWKPVSIPPRRESDIAILELDSAPPKDSQPGRIVVEHNLWGHSFRAFGFPAGCDKCVLAKGVIRDRTPNGRIVIEDINTLGFPVSAGFSGAPVWDNQVNGIVGMIVETEKYTDIRTAYMIPVYLLNEVLPILNQQTYTHRKEMVFSLKCILKSMEFLIFMHFMVNIMLYLK